MAVERPECERLWPSRWGGTGVCGRRVVNVDG